MEASVAGGAAGGHSPAARWSLSGCTALVTGGTRGIGFAVVEELAALGVKVHTCSRNGVELDERIRNWKEKGFRVSGSVCDLIVREQRVELLSNVATAFAGKLHILINNAGYNKKKPTVEYTEEDYSFFMATNFESAYHLCQLAHPLLKASGSGRIVFVSSVAGVTAFPSGSLYAAAKAGINLLTKNLACDWAKDNITVNSVAPWYIKTPMIEKLLENKEFVETVISRTPARRFGEPEEVSSVITYLCLPTARFITGQTITIDGGVTVNGMYPTKDD